MFDENTNPLGETVYQEIDQTPIQPEPEQAPEVAEAKSSEPVEPIAPEKQQSHPKRWDQDRNFHELRKREEMQQRELELMRREIDQLRQQNTNKQPKDELGIPKDSLAEIQQVERIVEQRLRERDMEYKRQLEQERQLYAERSLRAQYKDIDSVLTRENLQRLEYEEPEIASSIAANPDVYAAKVAAYKQIKKLGIVEENYNNSKVSERLAQNAVRMKNPAALAPRQGSQALSSAPQTNGYADTLNDDMMAKYRKEMEDAIRGMS